MRDILLVRILSDKIKPFGFPVSDNEYEMRIEIEGKNISLQGYELAMEGKSSFSEDFKSRSGKVLLPKGKKSIEELVEGDILTVEDDKCKKPYKVELKGFGEIYHDNSMFAGIEGLYEGVY